MQLPELLVVLVPRVGEQIVYNPLGAPEGIFTEAEARTRVAKLWQELYEREPGAVRRAESSFPGARRDPGGAPWLFIDDPLLADTTRGLTRIARDKWRHHPSTRTANSPLPAQPEPLIIYTAELSVEDHELWPQAAIFDAQANPGRASIVWNCGADLSASKLLHISNQAFFLRRYARRIARVWEQEYGRRPRVRAFTSVSLNGRPHQPLVDSAADLATVPVSWFRHNAWVRHLEVARVPRERLNLPPNTPARK
jgi:hypothetical protein